MVEELKKIPRISFGGVYKKLGGGFGTIGQYITH